MTVDGAESSLSAAVLQYLGYRDSSQLTILTVIHTAVVGSLRKPEDGIQSERSGHKLLTNKKDAQNKILFVTNIMKLICLCGAIVNYAENKRRFDIHGTSGNGGLKKCY